MLRKTLFLACTCLPLLLSAQADINAIDQYLSKSRQDWSVPGMAVAIVKDDEVLLAKGYGVKEAGKPDLVDEHTLFAIASNTKAFISSSLAILVDEGKISWDDPVQQYLPKFQLYDPYVSAETTIRDLLCHRVGLGTFVGDYMWYKSTLSATDLIKKIKFVPQNYGFRDGFGYSNLMFVTAGEVIKEVTGQPWDDFVKERFFNPLNMDRSITSTDELIEMGNYASPHKPYEDGNEVIPWINWDNVGAAGGILSSVGDMTQWMLMHLNSGVYKEDTILNAHQQNTTWTPHNSFVVSANAKEAIPGRHFSAAGLGWFVGDYHGNMLVTHSGGYDGMYSRVMMIPDQNLGIVVLTNSMKGISTPLCYYIVNQFLGSDNRDWSAEWLDKSKKDDSIARTEESREDKKHKKSKPTHDLEKYTGTYHSDFHGKIFVTQEEKELRLEFENAPALSANLEHWHYDTWQIEWDETHAWFDFGTVRFKLDNNLKIEGLAFDVPNNDIFFDTVDLKKIK